MKILVVLAHPDDPDFFCGATLARWVKAGHTVSYCLLTRGDKGARDGNTDAMELAAARELEQKAAGDITGVSSIRFLTYEDGCLVPNLEIRKEVTRVIREEKPDIVVSCDPTTYFSGAGYINHPDHRAAGLITMDAVFPGVGSPMFYKDLIAQGYEAHSIKEVWFSVTNEPNIVIDVTDTWDIKLQALLEHKTQIGEPEQFLKRMKSRHTEDSTEENPRFEEKFRRIVYR